MLKLLKYLKKREWLYALCALVFIVAQVWLDLKLPDYMNTITQIAQGGTNSVTGAAMSCRTSGQTAAICCCVLWAA